MGIPISLLVHSAPHAREGHGLGIHSSPTRAEALARYTKQRQYGLEIENDAAEIRLIAERRLGDMLKEIAKDHGGRPKKNQLHNVTSFSETTTLDDLGISKIQSHRWQREAALPEDAFQTYITETRAKGEELTSAAVLHQARAYLPSPLPILTSLLGKIG
jgi:hypothetical protein